MVAKVFLLALLGCCVLIEARSLLPRYELELPYEEKLRNLDNYGSQRFEGVANKFHNGRNKVLSHGIDFLDQAVETTADIADTVATGSTNLGAAGVDLGTEGIRQGGGIVNEVAYGGFETGSSLANLAKEGIRSGGNIITEGTRGASNLLSKGVGLGSQAVRSTGNVVSTVARNVGETGGNLAELGSAGIRKGEDIADTLLDNGFGALNHLVEEGQNFLDSDTGFFGKRRQGGFNVLTGQLGKGVGTVVDNGLSAADREMREDLSYLDNMRYF